MLSIVMPGKNVEDYIKKSVDSIVAQTFTDWELIFVDDQSSDKTADIIRGYQDERIKYFRTDYSAGVAHARNFGCARVSSDIIVVADSDDDYLPERLEDINKAFSADPDLSVFYANIHIINHFNQTEYDRPFQDYHAGLLGNINYVANVASAFKKKEFEELGRYDEKLLSAEDYDLWLRFSKAGYKFFGLDKVAVNVNQYSQSTSANRERLREYTHMAKVKNGLPEISDLDYVRQNASKEIFEYFTQPRGYALWFE